MKFWEQASQELTLPAVQKVCQVWDRTLAELRCYTQLPNWGYNRSIASLRKSRQFSNFQTYFSSWLHFTTFREDIYHIYFTTLISTSDCQQAGAYTKWRWGHPGYGQLFPLYCRALSSWSRWKLSDWDLEKPQNPEGQISGFPINLLHKVLLFHLSTARNGHCKRSHMLENAF